MAFTTQRKPLELAPLLVNGQLQEMAFTTQRKPLELEPLLVNGQRVLISDTVKYLGVTLDSKLRFEDHVDRIVLKSKQRLYIIRRFNNLKADARLVRQLFTAFIQSQLLYCCEVLYNSYLAKEQKQLRSVHNTAKRLGVDTQYSYDDLMQHRSEQFILSLYHKEDHPFHGFIERLPSGRLKAIKHRTLTAKNSFLRKYILFINSL